ncbi:Ras-like GTPase [Acrasis kona]|uniref:small monomeric GTPase n=1 Tax=Acrasis kona TaxID=1008807 RepID=A0AAW2ZQZ6_9EUKA
MTEESGSSAASPSSPASAASPASASQPDLHVNTPNVDRFKVAVVGSGAVGKSAITVMYVQNQFVECYDPTIEDSYRKHTKVDERVCILDVLDTAGQEEYRSLRDTYMRQAHGFFIVYSINSKASFDNLQDYVESIKRVKDKDSVPFVLFGNKADLENEREVEKEEGNKFVQEYMSGSPLFEGSAKTKLNVEEAFNELIRVIRNRLGIKPFVEEKKKKKCTIL